MQSCSVYRYVAYYEVFTSQNNCVLIYFLRKNYDYWVTISFLSNCFRKLKNKFLYL